MPLMVREDIYAALYAKFTPLTATFKTISRRLLHFNEVPPTAQPALFVTGGNQGSTYDMRGPARWLLMAELYVYARTDGKQNPGPVLNPLLDVIDNALAFDDVQNSKLTLGGLVEYCRIEGEVQIHEGAIGDQSIMIVPLIMRRQ